MLHVQINAPCCAEFLVTRTAILQLPKAFYEGTLAWFDSSHEESKRVGWIMEVSRWRWRACCDGGGGGCLHLL